MSVEEMKALAELLESRHEAIGYSDYSRWIESRG
jgi:hypothetical protein